MVTMSSGFTLPPVIRRFGRCGEWEQRMPSSTPSSEIGESSHNIEYGKGGETSEAYSKGAATGTDRVKSFVNGIVSPFAACWQPMDGAACGPVFADRVFRKQPSVVSPHLERVISYRDSRVEHNDPHEDYYSHSRRHHRNYHLRPMPAGPTYPSRRDPAAETTESSSHSAGTTAAAAATTTTTTIDKKKSNTDIAKPRSNDILCGRGGSSNRHLGNIHFRELVAANKQIYVGLTKKQKMMIARKIVDAIHKTDGRFLAKDLDTGMFYDIGLPRSLEKTSQALREKHSNEMPIQQVEDEGIETSVESHTSLIKKVGSSMEESKSTAEESATEVPPSSSKSAGSSSSSTKASKNNSTEAPDLIIPPHLKSKFGPQGSSSTHEEDLEHNHQHSLSPSSYHSDPSYDSHRSSYPPSPYRKGYRPPGAGHPQGHHHYPRYPPSPSNQYPSPHYYYPPSHPSQTPSYGQRGRGHDERYPYPDREVYSNEYYQRTAPHGQYHRYPRPANIHRGHPVARVSPHPPPARGAPPPPRSSYGPQQVSPTPPRLPPYQPSPHNSYYRYEGDAPSMLHNHDASSSSPPSRIIYRNTNSGYVRGNPDVSPGRQREIKRPRNGEGETVAATKTTTKATTPQTSDVSLSSAVKNSLSLDDRVVGKEREKQQQDSSSSSGQLNLVSPSTMLQAKSFSRGNMVVENDGSSPTESKERDYSALSGLAALSTAAFLKLDEDDDVKR